jgi:DNA-binding response OmpR family regulator
LRRDWQFATDTSCCVRSGYSDAPFTRTVDNFIFRLRTKIEPDPRHPQYIRTAYGDGYRLTVSD